MGIVQNLQTLLNEKKMWSAKVETEWHPKEGFFSQSAEKIASGLKRASNDLKQAMSRLNFYKNRAGKNLSAEDKARLDAAKEKLHSLYECVNEAKEKEHYGHEWIVDCPKCGKFTAVQKGEPTICPKCKTTDIDTARAVNESKKDAVTARPEPVTAEDAEGKKYRIYEMGVSWVALIPKKGDVSDKIKIPVGDLYEEYNLYDIKGKLVHAATMYECATKPGMPKQPGKKSLKEEDESHDDRYCRRHELQKKWEKENANKKRPGESNAEASERIGKQNEKKGPTVRNIKEKSERRGSQNREKLSDLKDEYTLITKRPIGAKNPTEVVLYNIPAKKQEVWGLSDDFAGYVIEINGKGYEFIRSLTKKED